MDEEPDWAKVIRTAYRSRQGVVQWKGDLPDDHEHQEEEAQHNLREETDLTDERTRNAVKFAERTGLISQIGTGMHYELKEKGFNVAHERALRSQQQSLLETQNHASSTLATFTVILGAAAIIQAAAAVVSAPAPYSVFLAGFYATIFFVLWWNKESWIPNM